MTNQLLSLTGPWTYTTNNLDGSDWSVPTNADLGWAGPSNALFFIESATLPAAKTTPLPASSSGRPFNCYYFRSTFDVPTTNELVALLVNHLVDDGAVFYLNGAEVQRVRMAAGPVDYMTSAADTPPDGDATAVESFTLAGEALRHLKPGPNTLAARLHQNGSGSSDAVFGASLAAVFDPDPDIRLVRGPYLQACTPTGVVVRWRTDFAESSRVTWQSEPDAPAQAWTDPRPTTEHEVLLSPLQPDTHYRFTVGSASRVLAGADGSCSFRTHPLPGSNKPLRLWVTGDAGTANSNARAVRDAFETANAGRPLDAWVQLGDNAYSSGTDEEYQAAMFDMYPERLRQTPVWTTLANHETYSTDWNGHHPYFNIFTIPTGGQAGGVPSGTEHYYAFDLGMLHVVSLDSMLSDRSANGPMAQWLRADLEANSNRWLIAVFHHPPYTKGSHDSDDEIELVEMRANILPILEAGGVDLVLCGHSHSYERSFLLDGHYGTSGTLSPAHLVDAGSGRETAGAGAYVKPEHASGSPIANRGAVYAVAGSSGKTSGGTLDHPAMFLSLNVLGSLVLDLSADRLDAVFLRETGATNDWFTLRKVNVAPVASNQIAVVDAERPAPLRLRASDVNRNGLTFAIVANPTNGLVSSFDPDAGTLTYTPARGVAADTLTFVASDGALASPPASVALHVAAPPDSDGDGLPDAWEAEHKAGDPSADPDGDGDDNLHEYRAGTDPNDRKSWLHVTAAAPRQAASGFQLAWASSGGTRYRILYCDGDAHGGFNGRFTPLPRPVGDEMDPRAPGTPGIMAFIDDFSLTGPPAHGCRYYRISVVP